MIRHRNPATAWAIGVATAALVAFGAPVAAAGPDAGADPVAAPAVAAGDFTPPATGATLAYVNGTHLRWSVFDQLGGDGAGSPIGSAVLDGVAGGPMGIVEVGADAAVGRGATWISNDGGVSWTEHIAENVPAGFWSVAVHGGVLVALAPNGLYSSTDGVTWIPATSGPHAPKWDGIQTPVIAGPQGYVLIVRNGTSSTTRVWRSKTGAPGAWTAAPYQASVAGFCATSLTMSSSRMVAVGADCGRPTSARVLTSTNGTTWTRVALPAGLRVGVGALTPSVSYVASRFLMTGSNANKSATWVWTSSDGISWLHVSSAARASSAEIDQITKVVKLGSGWVAVGGRSMLDAVTVWLVVWRSADLIHWSRYTITIDPAVKETIQRVNDAAVVGGRLVVVGDGWNFVDAAAPTWIAAVAP